ncbi:hypothetical protein HYH02_007306 [Chlamydomonas schloesseri]|uniref:Uncharacterized protein n=1 Tax=Chlamydomonas schloesseri TaxID=2026947 RepID=A0A835WI23_9CHLO|nr:hypothetical protein HYH02_007306 [Chlamydomonas schloesseri]|eukprot:KAG2447850.1 hypothetical protein HYH02_007306 [Chlamydomonas schloesseri]
MLKGNCGALGLQSPARFRRQPGSVQVQHRCARASRCLRAPLRLASPSAAAAAAAASPDADASLATITGLIGGPSAAAAAPLSYRAITTDPVFRPATAGCQQYAPGPPQLLGRRLTLNPLHGLTAATESQLGALDRAMAAVLDGRPLLQGAAAAALAALTALDLHPLSLLRLGLPEAVADYLELQVGGWLLPLAAGAALAAGMAAAAWQARTWVAAQLALAGGGFGRAVSEAEAARTAAKELAVAGAAAATGEEQGGAAAGAAVAAGGGAFSRWLPAALRPLFESDWKPTDRTWLYLIMAARLAALLLAASSLLSGASVAAAVFTALCFGASLLPAALPQLRALLPTSGAAAGLAAPLLAADAAFLVALAPAAPLAARAAAAAVLAAGLGLAATATAASGRLTGARAADGDLATFHVVLRLPLSGTLVDTTVGHLPLTSRVGADAVEAEQEAAAAAAAAAASAAADPRAAGSTSGAGCDPQERFRPIQAAVAAATLAGMYLGERRTVTLSAASAPGGGDAAAAATAGPGGGEDLGSEWSSESAAPFNNPGLTWWQPLEDLERKLGVKAGGEERQVRPGDVFWYPVGGLVVELGATRLSTGQGTAGGGAPPAAALAGADSWGPVRVMAVTGEWVQLDANMGLAGGEVEVEVELVGLKKAAAPA